MSRRSPRPTLLSIAMKLAFVSSLSLTLMPVVQAHNSVVSAQTATQNYNIPAGPLDRVLTRLAGQTGILLATSPEQVAGKNSPGINGTFNVQDALEAALADTGLQAVQDNQGRSSLQLASEPESITLFQMNQHNEAYTNGQNENTDRAMALPTVTVSAFHANDGSAEAGYLTREITQIGPWQGRSLQDTPYAISVMTKELIENAASGSFDQLFKLNPVLQNKAPFTVFGYPSVSIRGFNHSRGIVDGVKLSSYTYGLNTEELERVEVLNGLSGFMYGAGNVGGTVNYVLKRPTHERLTDVTLGNYGHEQWYAHIDLGDKIDEDGIFAYRLNVAYSNGETAKRGQEIERKVISGALDWNISDNFLLQFDAAYSEFNNDKPDTRFYSQGIDYWPKAFDNKETYTPDWTYNNTESKRAGVKNIWDINETFTLRSAYLYKEDTREHVIPYPIYTATGWTLYNPAKAAPYVITSQGAYAYLDSVFDTGRIGHKMTVGFSGDTSKEEIHENSYVLADPSFVTPTNMTLDDFMNMPRPDYLSSKDYGKRYKSTEVTNTNITLSDDITFNEKWSVLVGFNYATIKSESFSATGLTTAEYDESAITPTVSLIYKPVDNMTFYVSYIEGLEQGTVVPDDPRYNDPGKIFDPYISKQYEIGHKFMVAENLMLNTALFRLEKANSFTETDTNGRITLSQDGEQIHQGLEVTLTGKLTQNLTVYTGGTLMDLSVEKAANKDLEGKQPIGTASKMAKLYAEYALPNIPGLVLTGGVSYTGSKYKNSTNTQKIDAYTLFDLGARYTTQLYGNNVTFNLNATNLTNEDYWASEWQLGIPRSVSFSMKAEF